MWKLKPGKTEAQYKAEREALEEDKARREYEINEDFAARLGHLFVEFHEEIPETQEGKGM